LSVPELFSPELTAEWEFKLAQMEHGKLKRDAFMREIVDMTRHIVTQAKGHESDTIPATSARSKRRARIAAAKFTRTTRSFNARPAPSLSGRSWAAARSRSRKPTRCCASGASDRSKGSGAASASRSRRRSSSVTPNEVGFDFGDNSGDDGAEAPDFTGQEPLGPCPKCSSRVFETAQAYVCEKAVGPDKTCDFRSGRIILQRPIERPQMEKLLATGKTDLLQFVSARTKRPFAAFLVRQPDGKIGFEFEPRDPAKAGARRARGAAPALRVLGPHPRDKKPIELHSGRYGPLREARRSQRDDSGSREDGFADARRGGCAAG
jgi:DNA topoisomerase-3